jgi:hypothetical protein
MEALLATSARSSPATAASTLIQCKAHRIMLLEYSEPALTPLQLAATVAVSGHWPAVGDFCCPHALPTTLLRPHRTRHDTVSLSRSNNCEADQMH